MPEDLQNSENLDPTLFLPSWNPKNHKELAKMMVQKKVVNVTMKQNRASQEPKKICICSPTSHEGSFRCHLHRATGATKEAIDRKRATTKSGQPQLSRFGRIAASENTPRGYDLASQ